MSPNASGLSNNAATVSPMEFSSTQTCSRGLLRRQATQPILRPCSQSFPPVPQLHFFPRMFTPCTTTIRLATSPERSFRHHCLKRIATVRTLALKIRMIGATETQPFGTPSWQRDSKIGRLNTCKFERPNLRPDLLPQKPLIRIFQPASSTLKEQNLDKRVDPCRPRLILSNVSDALGPAANGNGDQSHG